MMILRLHAAVQSVGMTLADDAKGRREAFGLRRACSRFPSARKRRQAARSPNASRFPCATKAIKENTSPIVGDEAVAVSYKKAWSHDNVSTTLVASGD